jgi:hypothetical protein
VHNFVLKTPGGMICDWRRRTKKGQETPKWVPVLSFTRLLKHAAAQATAGTVNLNGLTLGDEEIL